MMDQVRPALCQLLLRSTAACLSNTATPLPFVTNLVGLADGVQTD
jgi:hypothetical protein